MPSMIKFISESPQDTIKFGKKIAKLLKPTFVVGLYGDLGSGKTTLVKGIAVALGVEGSEVNSPTFVLIKEYRAKFPLYHFDLYRLNSISQIEGLGYEEYLSGKGICVIEWAEKLDGLMPKDHVEVRLFHKGDDKRLIKVVARGKKYKDFVSKLKKDENISN